MSTHTSVMFPSARPADLLFPGRREAIARSACVDCDQSATQFDDDLSRAEYAISGLCQKCQDSIFASDEDDVLEFDADEPLTQEIADRHALNTFMQLPQPRECECGYHDGQHGDCVLACGYHEVS